MPLSALDQKIQSVLGRTCESAYIDEYWYKGEYQSGVKFVFKVRNGDWQWILFDDIDDGRLFWYQKEELDDKIFTSEGDDTYFKKVDVGAEFGLIGEKVVNVERETTDDFKLLRFYFSNNVVVTVSYALDGSENCDITIESGGEIQ